MQAEVRAESQTKLGRRERERERSLSLEKKIRRRELIGNVLKREIGIECKLGVSK